MKELVELHNGDCLEVLASMPSASVGAIVTDPPYGLSFMGRKWDYDVPSVAIWEQCLRVLKPGGHLLAFAGTRTQHRMCVNIEDAGFEIKDLIMWCYGSGFPKSQNVSKAIDKAAGAEREVLGIATKNGGASNGKKSNSVGYVCETNKYAITAPATPEAQQWDGWGTALKPALEPITVARKPIKSTVANNVLEHGTGAINIDGCRVGDEEIEQGRFGRRVTDSTNQSIYRDGLKPTERTTTKGRWPANLIHDGSDEVTELLNESSRFFQQCKGGYDDVWQDLSLPQSLASTAESNSSQQRQAAVSALALAVSAALPEGLHCSGLLMEPSTTATGNELRLIAENVTQTILNIAPRFWQESEPARLSLSNSPVNVVVQKEPTGTITITASHWKSDGSAAHVTYNITPNNLGVGEQVSVKRAFYTAKASKDDRDKGNTHPTVKPTDLMAYLCRLVTPPGGIVLDPFMGSGTTGKAALAEGFGFIGIERDPEYYAIAESRFNGAQIGLPLVS